MLTRPKTTNIHTYIQTLHFLISVTTLTNEAWINFIIDTQYLEPGETMETFQPVFNPLCIVFFTHFAHIITVFSIYIGFRFVLVALANCSTN